jgi:hypothetical protein
MPKKRCTSCRRNLPLNDNYFYRQPTSSDGYFHVCIDCQCQYVKHRYHQHKEKINEQNKCRNRLSIGVLRSKVQSYLSLHPCVDCGEEDSTALDFDHVWGSKLLGISVMVRRARSWNSIKAEISKCEVRCANCHRRRHVLIRDMGIRPARYVGTQVLQNQTLRRRYLLRHPCVDCGEVDTRVLEFDHVRGRKSAAISFLVRIGYPWQRIVKEIAKCEVRCANCHRLRHSKGGRV